MNSLFTTALLLSLVTYPVIAQTGAPEVHESTLTVTVPDQLDLYIERLAFLESSGREDIDIIDTNGKHSKGCLQFQDATFQHYAKLYHLEGDVFDCPLQKRIARQILLTGGWRNWYNSITNLGGPAAIPLFGVQEARDNSVLGRGHAIMGG